MIDMDSAENESRLENEKRKKVLIRILNEELTDLQRQTFWDYHFQKKSICRIAREREVEKSTVSRTLRRAEEKVTRYLKYYRMT